jgi:microcompartment protein CcmK/EutM
MITGKIVGTVVASRKVESLNSLRFLIVRRMKINGKLTDDYVVAADSVGAGIGEVVLVATGSSARQTDITNNKPMDALIMAIVDTFEIDGKVVYQKD